MLSVTNSFYLLSVELTLACAAVGAVAGSFKGSEAVGLVVGMLCRKEVVYGLRERLLLELIRTGAASASQIEHGGLRLKCG